MPVKNGVEMMMLLKVFVKSVNVTKSRSRETNKECTKNKK